MSIKSNIGTTAATALLHTLQHNHTTISAAAASVTASTAVTTTTLRNLWRLHLWPQITTSIVDLITFLEHSFIQVKFTHLKVFICIKLRYPVLPAPIKIAYITFLIHNSTIFFQIYINPILCSTQNHF